METNIVVWVSGDKFNVGTISAFNHYNKHVTLTDGCRNLLYFNLSFIETSPVSEVLIFVISLFIYHVSRSTLNGWSSQDNLSNAAIQL